ncbi:MAG: BlaI/MecI/CopY family transcriptional regulator [Cyanobacteria bacterium]|nr:BlaI/MecI/CopY family transcriptional regulator [Cyanobacteriota bacterium]
MDLKQGDLENIILNALWDLEGDGSDKIFVGDVQDKIRSSNKTWAYTTVKTVLDRLVDKEIAVREKDGKKFLYKSVVKRDEAGILAIQKVMRQFFKNDVEELSACLGRLKGQPKNASNSSTNRSTLPSERDAVVSQLDEARKTLYTQK